MLIGIVFAKSVEAFEKHVVHDELALLIYTLVVVSFIFL